MVRGTQKQIIHLKHTESSLFEEAFLILKPTATPPRRVDMVAEAERILSRKRDGQEQEQGGAYKTRHFPLFLSFLAGVLLGTLIPLLFL